MIVRKSRENYDLVDKVLRIRLFHVSLDLLSLPGLSLMKNPRILIALPAKGEEQLLFIADTRYMRN